MDDSTIDQFFQHGFNRMVQKHGNVQILITRYRGNANYTEKRGHAVLFFAGQTVDFAAEINNLTLLMNFYRELFVALPAFNGGYRTYNCTDG